MSSPDSHIHSIRNLEPRDRAAIANIVQSVGNFNQAEIECALELVDACLNDTNQKDYRIVVD